MELSVATGESNIEALFQYNGLIQCDPMQLF
jgi:hypothetical protein